MAHSYSSLKDFDQCPKKYHEVRILKRWPYVESAAALEGTRLHALIENAGRGTAPLTGAERAQYQWIIDGLISQLKGDIVYEMEFSLSKMGTVIGDRDWNNKFWTGKADCIAVAGDHAVVVDWKFGSDRYPDTEQLELMAIFAMMKFPDVKTVAGAIVFANTAKVVPATFRRKDFHTLYGKWIDKVKEIDLAIASGQWPTVSDSGKAKLCGWCPVTDCGLHPGPRA